MGGYHRGAYFDMGIKKKLRKKIDLGVVKKENRKR